MSSQREQVILSRKEQKRLKLLNDLVAGTTIIQPVLPAPVPQAQVAGQAWEAFRTPGLAASACTWSMEGSEPKSGEEPMIT
ncbi:MAG: hypothetical protein IH953_05555 [Chloroflexi bacterium]|nr:hypothetical protein [Chloroflexota bacterium]